MADSFFFGLSGTDALVGMDRGDAGGTVFTGDRSIHFSDDGARQAERLYNVVQKKRRVRLLPSRLDDSLAKWIPVNDLGCEITDAMDAISGASSTSVRPGGKRKSYASSDEPMSEFPEVQQLYLDETLHMHGTQAAVGSGKRRFFRCKQCGVFDQCLECCLSRHALSPLHVLQEWQGDYWKPISLHALGLVYQLGHGGLPCGYPEAVTRTLTVVHTTAIQEISYRYCNCGRSDTANNLVQLLRNAWYPASKTDPDTVATFEVLDLYRLLNVVGHMNVRDFITSLERLTDSKASTGMNWLPDCYKAFGRMCRQWAFLQRARRAGRAYDPEGLVATKAGELVPACWPCPHEGRNLPINWRLVESQYRYLYRLILALDANFKLKNRIRKNEHPDPSLGPGWGAFVEPARYKKHLRKYVAEKDISTCIAFAALTQKETRNTAGLRVSGVGGCVCARHECIRPNGMGDLQKGERYANMDYILLSALADTYPQELTKLPKELQRDWKGVLLQSGLPVWHALAHECKNENNLNLLPGVGKTDGEGIERLWAVLNGSAWQTKEMTLGNRADTLEDMLDSHNYLKNLSQSTPRGGLGRARAAGRSIKEINKTIHAEKRAEWQAKIDLFIEDRSNPNPYVLSAQDGPSEADIRLLLKKDEQEAAAQGRVPLHSTSATAFLTAGLQLEDAQRRIKAETSAPGQMTADRASKIEEHRVAFFAKLRPFRALQQVYTPGAKLHAKGHLITFRNANVMGQVRATRSRSLIEHLGVRVDTLARKYTDARAAMHVLRGAHYAPQLRKLEKGDLRIEGEGEANESDAAKSDRSAAKKLRNIGGRPAREAPTGTTPCYPGSGRHLALWIARRKTYTNWSKAKARKTRWEEEVELLREEMKRVMRYLEWEAGTWDTRAAESATRVNMTAAARSGLRGSAHLRFASAPTSDFRSDDLGSLPLGATVHSGDFTSDPTYLRHHSALVSGLGSASAPAPVRIIHHSLSSIPFFTQPEARQSHTLNLPVFGSDLGRMSDSADGFGLVPLGIIFAPSVLPPSLPLAAANIT
ncbi:hypothetical protein C8R47DRAFT_1329898 [Mycena vitilis]|nr:hypothetical protein C8R47DRAFT_1329898 [Mycena vitilis]